jgi:hypothetical protein
MAQLLKLIHVNTPATIIAVCNNVGEAAFLGPNQKFENPLPRAS